MAVDWPLYFSGIVTIPSTQMLLIDELLTAAVIAFLLNKYKLNNYRYPKSGEHAYYYKKDDLNEIGRGGFGIVYKATRKNDN